MPSSSKRGQNKQGLTAAFLVPIKEGPTGFRCRHANPFRDSFAMSGTIQLKLFATLSSRLPASADRYPIEEKTTVRDVVEALKIPERQAKLIFVNGEKKPLDTLLKDGDRLGIFPPVGGG